MSCHARSCQTDYVGATLYGQRHRLFGFCCSHYGRGHDGPLFLEFLKTVEATPNAIVFGLGDYLDFTRTTHRSNLRGFGGDDLGFREEVDTMVMKQLVEPYVWLFRKHAPSALKRHAFLGFVEGNHHYEFLNGTTSTQKICELLGIRYLGLSAWVQLACYRSKGKTKLGTGKNLNVVLNHSASSSGNLSGSLAQANKKLAGCRGVDVFLTGNDHQLGHEVQQQIGCTQSGVARMMQHEVVIGKCGSFQKGYEEGAQAQSYVEKKFLRPSHLGWLSFDAWAYCRSTTHAERAALGVTHTPEVWRFGAFNV